MTTHIKSTISLWLCSIVLLITSCAEDDTLRKRDINSKDAEVTLSVQLPGVKSNDSAPTESSYEDTIETIDVFVFDSDGILMDYATGTNIQDISSGGQIMRSFTVTLLAGENREVMVITNLGNNENFFEDIYRNMTKENLIKLLTLSIAPAEGWNTNRLIPMWGVKQNFNIGTGSSTLNGIRLSRMLAKANIKINETGLAGTDFEMTSVRLYNYHTVGRIIPDNSELWDNDAPSATAPSLVNNAEVTQEEILYSPEETIYLFEAAKGVDPSSETGDYLKNTCLVIGALYEGIETFYRADFTTTEGSTVNYLDILRNYNYDVIIKAVSGPGKSSPEEALNSIPDNIQVGIVSWNDYNMDSEFDGRYYYGITPIVTIEWADATENNSLLIKTDYPSWSFSISDCEDPDDPNADPAHINWLTVTSNHNVGGEYPGNPNGTYLTFNLERNPVRETREAYLHIKAGRIIMSAKIIQHPWYIEEMILTPEGPIATAGETRTVTFKGSFENTAIRARDPEINLIIDADTLYAPVIDDTNFATLTIPELWKNGTRTILFEYFHSAHQTWKAITNEEQEGYSLDVSTSHQDGEFIPNIGKTFQIKVTGNWPALYVQAINRETGLPITDEPVPVSAGHGETTTETITISGNASWTQRYIEFQWSVDQETWSTISVGLQNGYEVKRVVTAHQQGEVIPRRGKDYIITVEGFYPDVYVRAINDVTKAQIVSPKKVPGGSGVNSEEKITISANPSWMRRIVRFQYAYSEDSDDWNDLTSGEQETYFITSGFITDESTPTARTGGSVTIQLEGEYGDTPIQSRKLGEDTPLATGYVLAGENNKGTVAIPANREWTATATRRIEVGYVDPGTEEFHSLGSPYEQDGCYISGGEVTSNYTNKFVPREGGNVQIQIFGDYDNVPVQAYVRDTDELINLYPQSTGEGTDNIVTLEFKGNEEWSRWSYPEYRFLKFGYIHPATNNFVVLDNVYRQPGYYFSGGGIEEDNLYIPREGGSLTLFIGGEYPKLTVEVQDLNNNREVIYTTFVEAGINNSTIFFIPEYPHYSSTTEPEIRFLDVGFYHPKDQTFKSAIGREGPYQESYYISDANVINHSFPLDDQKGSATIQIDGDFGPLTMYAKVENDKYSKEYTATLPASVNNTNTKKIEIDPNQSWYRRTVKVGYWHPGRNEYMELGSYTQDGYFFSTPPTPTILTPITTSGGKYRVTAEGYFDDITIGIFVNSNGIPINEAKIPKGISTTGPRFADIEVPAGRNRNITLQYQRLDGSWVLLAHAEQ